MGSASTGGFALVLSAGVLFGTIPVFSTLLSSSGINAVVQLSWRVAAGAPILLFASLLMKPAEVRSLRLRDVAGLLGVGGVLLVLLFAYIESLALGTPVATAVVLLYSQPVFTVLLSAALGEKITPTRLLALLLGFSGVLVVVGPAGTGRGPGLGEISALASGVAYAAYIVASRRVVRAERFHPITATSLSFTGALLVLTPVALLLQASSSGAVLSNFAAFSPAQGSYLAGLILLGTILPYLALNIALVKTEASVAGVTLLVEPISASSLGYLILGQALAINQAAGALLIFSSVILVSPRVESYFARLGKEPHGDPRLV